MKLSMALPMRQMFETATYSPSVADLISSKWKVAYDELSLEAKQMQLDPLPQSLEDRYGVSFATMNLLSGSRVANTDGVKAGEAIEESNPGQMRSLEAVQMQEESMDKNRPGKAFEATCRRQEDDEATAKNGKSCEAKHRGLDRDMPLEKEVLRGLEKKWGKRNTPTKETTTTTINNNNNNNNHPTSTGNYALPKKSQSVPPPASRSIDCLDCPAMTVEESARLNIEDACACNLKRKGPQDSLQEQERKFCRSSSLELEPAGIKGHFFAQDDTEVNTPLGRIKEAAKRLEEEEGGRGEASGDRPHLYQAEDEGHEPLNPLMKYVGQQRLLLTGELTAAQPSGRHGLKQSEEAGRWDKEILRESTENQNLSGEVEVSSGRDESNKRRSRRRKRHRRDSGQDSAKENKRDTRSLGGKSRNNSIAGSIGRDKLSGESGFGKADDDSNRIEEAENDEPRRKNALNFLYAREEPSPNTACRQSSVPLLSNRHESSPPLLSNRSASTSNIYGGGEEQTADTGCWVSRRLAHMISAESEKETMSLESSESPRAQAMLSSNRFMQMDQHLDTSRNVEETEKPRVRQLTKQLSNLEKKIKQLEHKFQEQNGYRPSHQDKLNNTQFKKLMAELAGLKLQLKTEERKTGLEVNKTAEGGSSSPRKISTGENSLDEVVERRDNILRSLKENREAKGRAESVQEMSYNEILEEKVEMHCLLREYEKEFGHPEAKEEKEAMKEIYERYRVIKRLARRSSMGRSGDSVGELIPIPEEEEIDLTNLTPANRINLNLSQHALPNLSTYPNHAASPPLPSRHDMDLPNFGGSHSSSGGSVESPCRSEPTTSSPSSMAWHAMPRHELLAALKHVHEEKKVARRAVKEFEDRFRTLTGRKVTKEDREPLEKTYEVYKTSKSKMKLINALLSKDVDANKNFYRLDR